jgi:deoxyribodipyrimidine photo-lyase
MPQKTTKGTVPQCRIQPCNEATVRGDGRFVLYWMTACRRVHWNFSLDRAVEWAEKLNKPLMILEALRVGLPLGFGPASPVHHAGDAG